MTSGKLKGMVFTSKKVSLRVKINVYSAMVLSVLLHGAAESWALSRTQLSGLETLHIHNSWLRCITRDTVGRPDSISTKDLMEKTHRLPISVMIKERRLRWLGHAARRSLSGSGWPYASAREAGAGGKRYKPSTLWVTVLQMRVLLVLHRSIGHIGQLDT